MARAGLADRHRQDHRVSLRQAVTPVPLLNRTNGTFRFLLTGAIPVGAALAGVLGQYASVRTSLWIGATAGPLTWLPVFCSPLRTLRQPPEPGPTPADRCYVAVTG